MPSSSMNYTGEGGEAGKSLSFLSRVRSKKKRRKEKGAEAGKLFCGFSHGSTAFAFFLSCGAPPPNPTLALFPVNGNGRRAKEEAEEDGSTDFRPACPGEDPERKPPPPFLFLSPFAISFGRVANIVRWLQRSSGQEGVRFSVSRRKRDKKREGGGGEETEERDRGGRRSSLRAVASPSSR